MRRFSYWPYLLLLLFYLCIFSVPKPFTERLRSVAVCSFSPGWHALDALKSKALYLLTLPLSTPTKDPARMQQELGRLQQENKLLQTQLEQVREWLLADDRLQEQHERLKLLEKGEKSDPQWETFFKRRAQELCQRMELNIKSIAARVIFREPSSWSTALWINVGEKHNKVLGKTIVAKNSPVLLGTALIGVVEYVGNARSRIRLITDERLAPSVRALRGREQNRFLLEHLETVRFALERREDLFASKEEAQTIFTQLNQLSHRLVTNKEDMYLAKGELFGNSLPLWRSRGQILKGIGFNYDFPDEEGPARDLRSGVPYEGQFKQEPVALLRPGDMLVTTGLDGIFPPGYRVATVSKVHMLKEGASSYEIEAVAAAGNLDEITHVLVLPPID